MYIYDQNISDSPLTEGGATEIAPPDSLRQRPGDTLPYREAMEETERKQYEEYQRDCSGRRILQTLERESLSPLERVRRLERKLAGIPHMFELYHKLQDLLRRRAISPVRFESARRGLLVAHGFPPQYALSTQDSELANARCELSKARWEFMVAMRTGRVPGRLLRR
jgi:hypothetical protein